MKWADWIITKTLLYLKGESVENRVEWCGGDFACKAKIRTTKTFTSKIGPVGTFEEAHTHTYTTYFIHSVRYLWNFNTDHTHLMGHMHQEREGEREIENKWNIFIYVSIYL